jgi:hypothetical protein
VTFSCKPGHGTATVPCGFSAALEKLICSSAYFRPSLMPGSCEMRSTTTRTINGDHAYAVLPRGGRS